MHLITILIIIIFLILIYGLYRYIKYKNSMKKISSALDDILTGNINRRFFAGGQNTALQNHLSKLNSLMENFQNVVQLNLQAEEARKRMISDISHDLRTPLTSIQGFMEALQNDRNLSNVEKEEYISIVVEKCHTLSELVQSFFELSRLEEDETVIPLVKTDINASIRAAISSFYSEFEKEGIIPEIKLPTVPTFVYANGAELDRVLQNLISNTLYYGKDGQVFGISVEEVQNKVWVNIWDKGQGIPKEELQFIFDRSFKLRSTAAGKPNISGLGLAIVKKLVEKQNGEISVSSNQGDRTVFSFCLEKYNLST